MRAIMIGSIFREFRWQTFSWRNIFDFFHALLPLFCTFIISPDDEVRSQDLVPAPCGYWWQSRKQNEQQPLAGPQGTELSHCLLGSHLALTSAVIGESGLQIAQGKPASLYSGVVLGGEGVRSDLGPERDQRLAPGGEEGEGLVGSRVG